MLYQGEVSTAKTGTWNLDTLNANSDAIIVFTVTAKKAGSTSNTPSVNFTDNGGSNSVTAPNNNLKINKDVRTSYSITANNKVGNKLSVKTGSYFYYTVNLKNSGIDTSDLITIQPKIPSGFTVAKTYTTFKYSNGKWAGKLGANKTGVLKMIIKVNKKGTHQLPILINGQTKKTFTVTGT